jgi:hypothetical protein
MIRRIETRHGAPVVLYQRTNFTLKSPFGCWMIPGIIDSSPRSHNPGLLVLKSKDRACPSTLVIAVALRAQAPTLHLRLVNVPSAPSDSLARSRSVISLGRDSTSIFVLMSLCAAIGHSYSIMVVILPQKKTS